MRSRGAFISFGIKRDDIFIRKTVRYNVIPIGIRTTIPAIKLFLILEKNDFFVIFLDIVYE